MTGLLQRFVNVRRDEVAPILLSALYFFFVLTALGAVRPARETLGMESGLDAVRWLFVGTAIITLLVNPVFGKMVARYRRLVFITATYLFFAASLLGFWALLVFAPNAIGSITGRVVYVWFSVFNLFSTMVFWALMADRFTLEQAKRLFPVIAVGGTAGAIFGPGLAFLLAEPLGTPGLLLVGATFLVASVGAAWAVGHMQPDHARPTGTDGPTPSTADEHAIIGGSAWQGLVAIVRSRYLSGIAVYMLITAIIATFLYFTRLQMVAELGDDSELRTTVFAQIDMFTQLATLILQLIVAGHLMKRLGVALTLAILPVTVALGFIGLAVMGSLAALILFQAAFNAVQRAIMRPARETLFTVVSREDKYKAKAATDTFVYRAGDVAGAFSEGAISRLGSLVALTSVAVPLAIVWGVLGVWLGRKQEEVARTRPDEPGTVRIDRPAAV